MKVLTCARALVLFAACVGGACASTSSGAGAASHGRLTEMSRVEGEIVFCSHQVPEPVCTRHHPELIPQFQRAQDWCPPHGVPESQCFECHPDLTFDPLPQLGPDADVSWLSRQGEDVPHLESHVVRGKVTVFDFYADWCAACRKVDGYVFKRLAANDETLAYRKINVVSWESPVSQRYLQDVPSLPLLVVYGRDGQKVASMHGANLDRLEKVIAEAAAR